MRDTLKTFIDQNFSRKIKSVDEIKSIISDRPRDAKVIMCHGVFDVVHPGHVRHLLYAKSKAKLLIASLTADKHIEKGDFRPFVPEGLRALNLAALEMVDYVLIDGNSTPIENIKILQPDLFAKGYEYTSSGVSPKTEEEIKVVQNYGGEVLFTPGDIVYSSTELINLSPPSISSEKLLVLMHDQGLTFSDIRACLNSLGNVSVHVVGDTIVDSYTDCSMIGGMTKTPTMSVRFESRRDFSGGAAIVAKHLAAAGAKVRFTTILGDDEMANLVRNDLAAVGVEINEVVDPARPTTNKNAIVVGGYRLLKLDTLDNRPISGKILDRVVESVSNSREDVVVFSDFRHGIFNKTTIPRLVSSIPLEAVKVADSQVASRWGNILEFQNFDLITPNEREARFALGDQDSIIRPLGQELHARANAELSILKCGPKGLIAFTSGSKLGRDFFVLDSMTKNVVDPVGAGDALLSYAALSLKVSNNHALATILGNIAAGIECEFDGNIPVTLEAMQAKLDEVEKQTGYER